MLVSKELSIGMLISNMLGNGSRFVSNSVRLVVLGTKQVSFGAFGTRTPHNCFTCYTSVRFRSNRSNRPKFTK